MRMRTRTVLAAGLLAALTVTPGCTGRSDGSAATPRSLSAAPAAAAAATPAKAAERDPFRETIRPILSARCGKCHDPGGKMYARLPFDDPNVVSSHSAAVLRRLKGDDRAAMEKWLADLAPAADRR
jgi:cytochrome c553